MSFLAKSHFVSAVLGGLIVGGGFLLVGVTGHQRTETIFEEAPVAARPSAETSSPLTPNAIYQRDAPAVVYVRAKLLEPVVSPFQLYRTREADISTGSGFLVDRHGDILTNYHLIDGASRSDGVTVEFEDDVIRSAGVAAVDPKDDLAVLRVDMRGVPPVRPLTLGDSSSVRVGDPALTIGNPFGVDRTLNSGIVSALQHQIEAIDGQMIDNVIQTDLPVDAANSGAPLLDAGGQVVGVNSQVSTGTPSQNLGFAIPSDTADSVLAKVDHRVLRLAYIGLSAPTTGKSPGAVVGSVARGGPAFLAGLQRGDLIERLDGDQVDTIGDVLAIVSTRSPGQSLALQIRRGHLRRTVSVTLGSYTTLPQGGG